MGFYTKINFQGDCMLNNEKITLMTKLSLYEQKNQKKEETELAITTNEITDSCIQIIKVLAKQYKGSQQLQII